MLTRSVVAAMKAILRRTVPRWMHPNARLERLVRVRTGLSVYSGPFKGLKYVDDSVGSVLYPKLLGIYERELAPALERIATLRLEAAIDIGAAEGYYAVGLLHNGSVRTVLAFEQTEKGRQLIRRMASLNHVSERVVVAGRCEVAELAAALESSSSPALVICDVEGYEATLLDPDRIPALTDAFILVELHEFAHRGITDIVRRRFEHSHSIQEFREQPRGKSDMPFRNFCSSIIPAKYFRSVTSEYRPEIMAWFWMEPNEVRQRRRS